MIIFHLQLLKWTFGWAPRTICISNYNVWSANTNIYYDLQRQRSGREAQQHVRQGCICGEQQLLFINRRVGEAGSSQCTLLGRTCSGRALKQVWNRRAELGHYPAGGLPTFPPSPPLFQIHHLETFQAWISETCFLTSIYSRPPPESVYNKTLIWDYEPFLNLGSVMLWALLFGIFHTFILWKSLLLRSVYCILCSLFHCVGGISMCDSGSEMCISMILVCFHVCVVPKLLRIHRLSVCVWQNLWMLLNFPFWSNVR